MRMGQLGLLHLCVGRLRCLLNGIRFSITACEWRTAFIICGGQMVVTSTHLYCDGHAKYDILCFAMDFLSMSTVFVWQYELEQRLDVSLCMLSCSMLALFRLWIRFHT